MSRAGIPENSRARSSKTHLVNGAGEWAHENELRVKPSSSSRERHFTVQHSCRTAFCAHLRCPDAFYRKFSGFFVKIFNEKTNDQNSFKNYVFDKGILHSYSSPEYFSASWKFPGTHHWYIWMKFKILKSFVSKTWIFKLEILPDF